MADTPSTAFNPDESVTELIGTQELKKTYAVKNISGFDESIGFAKVKADTLKKISHVPRHMDESKDYSTDWRAYIPEGWNPSVWGGVTPYELLSSKNKTYDVQPYAAICYIASTSDTGYYMKTGSDAGIAGNGDIRLVYDYPVDKMLFKLTVRGLPKSEMDEYDKETGYPSVRELNVHEFLEAPYLYYIRSYSLDCYLWNDTTNTWVSNSKIKPCLVFNDDDTYGIKGVSINNNMLVSNLTTSSSSALRTYDLVTQKASGGTNTNFMSNLGGVGEYVLSSQPDLRLIPIGMASNGETLNYGWTPVGSTDAFTMFAHCVGTGEHLDDPYAIFIQFTSYKMTTIALINGEFLYDYLASLGIYICSKIPGSNDPWRYPKHLFYSRDLYLGKIDDEGNTTGDLIDAYHIPGYRQWNRNGSTVEREYHEIIDESTWIRTDESLIPTKTFFMEEAGFTDVPNNAWFSNGGNPSKKCFPIMYGFTDIPNTVWGIEEGTKYTGDFPYKKDIPYKGYFPQMYKYSYSKKRNVKGHDFRISLNEYKQKIVLEDYTQTIRIKDFCCKVITEEF